MVRKGAVQVEVEASGDDGERYVTIRTDRGEKSDRFRDTTNISSRATLLQGLFRRDRADFYEAYERQ
jgi:hypothetical protein